LREQGQSLSQIGDAVGLSQPGVKKILDAASSEPAQGVNFAHGAQSLRADAGAAEPDNTGRYQVADLNQRDYDDRPAWFEIMRGGRGGLGPLR
jgi:hypothetical protein